VRCGNFIWEARIDFCRFVSGFFFCFDRFFWLRIILGGGVSRLLFALRRGRTVRSGRRTLLGRELGVWVLVLYEVTQYSIRSAEQNNFWRSLRTFAVARNRNDDVIFCWGVRLAARLRRQERGRRCIWLRGNICPSEYAMGGR
jgi:hypothetical protein